MAFGPLPPLDNSLFLARLQQQQAMEQKAAQEAQLRHQQAQELAQATMAQEQHAEGLRNSEFERSLKLAQLQGETAGYKGEEAPTFQNPERAAMSEYGQAKTAFDTDQAGIKNELSRSRIEARVEQNLAGNRIKYLQIAQRYGLAAAEEAYNRDKLSLQEELGKGRLALGWQQNATTREGNAMDFALGWGRINDNDAGSAAGSQKDYAKYPSLARMRDTLDKAVNKGAFGGPGKSLNTAAQNLILQVNSTMRDLDERRARGEDVTQEDTRLAKLIETHPKLAELWATIRNQGYEPETFIAAPESNLDANTLNFLDSLPDE